MNQLILCLTAFSLAPTFVFAQKAEDKNSSSLTLGLLEYASTPSFPKGKIFSPAVRAIFYKKEGKWVPGDATKGITKWKILFDGKVIGNITSDDTKTQNDISSRGLQTITSANEEIPLVGKLTDEFATWSDFETYRPLVLTTGNSTNDPANWKRAKLSSKKESAVKKEFTLKFNEVLNCKDAEENKAKIWKYRDKDIKILKSYSSKENWTIASLQLSPHRCDGPPEDAFTESWFLISPIGKPSYLDSGITLVDAGDYDGDGKSELIFQVSRYNKGGYIMYYDDFKQSVDFVFGYH